jgi:hypothetical protein
MSDRPELINDQGVQDLFSDILFEAENCVYNDEDDEDDDGDMTTGPDRAFGMWNNNLNFGGQIISYPTQNNLSVVGMDPNSVLGKR